MATLDALPGGYMLRTVRVGIRMTVLTLAVLAGYAAVPGRRAIHVPLYAAVIAVCAGATTVVASLDWERLFETGRGRVAMYLWSAADIALISVAIVATGGGPSDLWVLYVLTTLFFAVSYPERGQGVLLACTAAGYLAALRVSGWGVEAAALLLRLALLVLVFCMAAFLARELRAYIERHAEVSLRARLAESQARRAEWFRSLVHDSSDIVTAFDAAGRIVYVSPAIRSFGYGPEELVGTPAATLVHPDDLRLTIEELTGQFEGERAPRPIEYRARTAGGVYRVVEGVATNLLDEPTVNAIVVNARDVTERKLAERLVASQCAVLEKIASGESLDAVLQMIATMVDEQTGARCTIEVDSSDGSRVVATAADEPLIDPCAGPDGHASWSRAIVSSDGEARLGEVRLLFAEARFATQADRQVADAAANLGTIVLERDLAKARIAYQARHDALTGLANRQVFVDALQRALTGAVRSETIAVLFLDLDHFKDVNDAFGHHVGDRALAVVGQRLVGTLGAAGTIARFGGDEFVALRRVDDSAHALELASLVLARVREPVSVGAARVTVDASIGVTLACVVADAGPRWRETGAWVEAACDELLREADLAMYRAKAHGGGRVELYDAARGRRPAGDALS